MRHSSRWLIGMTASLVLLLSPAWALANRLDIPGDGATVSGIGVISGWKCEAAGDITVRFDEGDHIPLVYGSSRGDTGVPSVCNDDGLNGFVAIWNWGLLSDGEHTAVVYDNDMEFARSTFTVVNFGQEFVEATRECTIEDFPAMGETATFAWSESTQHLELAEIMGAPEDPEDMDPGVARFDGTWHAEANTTGSGCLITEFDCEISNGDLSCLRSVLRGTVDSSGSVVGVVHLNPAGEFEGTLQDGSGEGTVSYLNCSGTWTLTKQ